MKIIITGADGQLAKALFNAFPHHEVTALNRHQLDITSSNAEKTLSNLKPDCVFNAAAYTSVDHAESHQQNANDINNLAVASLARICNKLDARLIHFSTDFVFDGTANTPYSAEHQCNPINVYGKTKLDGENAIKEILPDQSIIIRTAWLYSAYGNNFITTMLRLMNANESLNIVYDQIGTPTSVESLANFCTQLLETNLTGIYHWTDAGIASWYDFAVAIFEEARATKLLNRTVSIKPITSAEYPTPAKRPHYSVLDKQKSYDVGGEACHWRTQLRKTIKEISMKEQISE